MGVERRVINGNAFLLGLAAWVKNPIMLTAE